MENRFGRMMDYLDMKFNSEDALRRARELYGEDHFNYKALKKLKSITPESIREVLRDDPLNAEYIITGMEVDEPLKYFDEQKNEWKLTQYGYLVSSLIEAKDDLDSLIESYNPRDGNLSKQDVENSLHKIKTIKKTINQQISNYLKIEQAGGKNKELPIIAKKDIEFLQNHIKEAEKLYVDKIKWTPVGIGYTLKHLAEDEGRMAKFHPWYTGIKYGLAAVILAAAVFGKCNSGKIPTTGQTPQDKNYSIVAEINGQKTEISQKYDVKAPVKMKIVGVKADGKEMSLDKFIADIIGAGDCNDIGKELYLQPGNYGINVSKIVPTEFSVNVLPGEQPTPQKTPTQQTPQKTPTQQTPQKTPTQQTPQKTPDEIIFTEEEADKL